MRKAYHPADGRDWLALRLAIYAISRRCHQARPSSFVIRHSSVLPVLPCVLSFSDAANASGTPPGIDPD
jgi:hypothetical protein